MYFILHYRTIDNFITEREKYRAEHLKKVKEAFNNQHLVLGGSLESPANEALLVFECEDEDIVKNFAQNDPYVINELITSWVVRKWNVVIGKALK